MVKVLIVYASDHGSVEKMANAVAEGVKTVSDCEAVIKKADEAKMEDLLSCDALVLGSPVHMGSIDWRVKKFIDSVCSGAWMKDKTLGKVGAVFAVRSWLWGRRRWLRIDNASAPEQHCRTRDDNGSATQEHTWLSLGGIAVGALRQSACGRFKP